VCALLSRQLGFSPKFWCFEAKMLFLSVGDGGAIPRGSRTSEEGEEEEVTPRDPTVFGASSLALR